MSEWWPWIDHDGKGCPCVGQYVQLELDRDADVCPPHKRQLAPRLFEGIVTPEEARLSEWKWGWMHRIIRYRIRKPRGLTILEELLSDLPAPSAPKVDA